VSKAVLDLTETTFDEEVGSSSVPIVVEFWAEWCPPCKAIAPILDDLAKEYDERLGIFKVNADEELTLARRFEITSIPTMLFFGEGTLQRRITGARSRSRLTEEIRDFIDS
jgi:thioredoxin